MRRSPVGSTSCARRSGSMRSPTVQTTAIDQTAGMVNLTTTLAHASGEWIASDWPVCPIAETANPQRMGAALTYARRYALFTLVGIAGEDDLDAPDLCDGPRSPAPPADERSLKPGHGQPPVQQRKPGNGQRRYGIHGERPSTLEPEQSAALREKLLTAVGSITSADNAAIWAREALAAKNRLAAADAKLVEDAFEHRLSELAPSATVGAADDAAPTTRVERVGVHEMRAKGNDDLDQAEGIDKSVLVDCDTAALSKPRAPSLCCPTGVSHLRPQTIRSASSPLPAAAGARPQGQR